LAEGGGDGRAGAEPDFAVCKAGRGPAKALGDAAEQRVNDKARVTAGQVGGDGGILFLVADNVPHSWQAAGDRVKAFGNTLAKRAVD
jgi:hypothetical protein